MRVYHDFVSPFCRVAVEVVERVAGETGDDLRYFPFELRPAPAELGSPREPAWLEELELARDLAEDWEVDLGLPPLLPRTRKAHEAVVHARAAELERPLVLALYRALWLGGRDIGRLDVLVEVGARAGVDPDTLHVALGLDEHAGAVAESQRESEELGITGVPTFEAAGNRLVGLVDPVELKAWLNQAAGEGGR